MKGIELVKLLEKQDWRVDRISGSHYVMKKGSATEIIPVHNRDIPKGLCNAILKRVGLK